MGAFGIDGVLTAEGFRPTELNTRMSAGFTQVTQLDRKLFALLQDALVLGEDPGVRVADVEALLPLIDADPSGRAVALAKDVVVGDVTEALTWDGERFEIAPRNDPRMTREMTSPAGERRRPGDGRHPVGTVRQGAAVRGAATRASGWPRSTWRSTTCCGGSSASTSAT